MPLSSCGQSNSLRITLYTPTLRGGSPAPLSSLFGFLQFLIRRLIVDMSYPYPYPYPWAPMVSYPYPYPYPWFRTRTRTHTHGFVPIPVPVPMIRTHTTSLLGVQTKYPIIQPIANIIGVSCYINNVTTFPTRNFSPKIYCNSASRQNYKSWTSDALMAYNYFIYNSNLALCTSSCSSYCKI